MSELLVHPAFASVERVVLPVSSSSEVAIQTAKALYDGLKMIENSQNLLKALRFIEFVPYSSGDGDLGPAGNDGEEHRQEALAFIKKFEAEWPNLLVDFPDIDVWVD